MKFLLVVTAPLIYILIILFSAWIGVRSDRPRRGVNARTIIAILAGLATCPLVMVMIQLGKLDIPSVGIVLPMICVSMGVGFFVGLGYIWSASLVLDNSAMNSLFVLGTIGGSSICLYFYIFQSQVQDILISTAWGFLFGVLVYMVLKGGPNKLFSRLPR